MAVNMIKIAAFYFVVGVFMGMYMSMGDDHSIVSAHAHLNLLGWLSLAVCGIVYHLFPAAAESKLGKVHYWLHIVGVPIMIIGLVGAMKGIMALYAAVPLGATAVTVGVLLFFINVLRHVPRRT